MPTLQLEYIVLFVAFVLPGAISMYVYGLKVPQADRKLRDQVLEAICFSIINFVLLFWFIQFLFQPNFLITHPFISWLLVVACFVIAPAIWPFMIVLLLRFAEKQSWVSVQARTAWDDFFSQAKSGCWVMIQLADSSQIGGRFGERSYASSYPEPGHIYLEELWEVRDDGTFGQRLPGKPGVLLRPDDYKFVRVFLE